MENMSNSFLYDPLKNSMLYEQQFKNLPTDLTGPLFISWDITNRCNLQCAHCLNRSGDTNYHDFTKELNHQESLNLCHQIIEINPMSVCLCGGEPLLRNDFFEIVAALSGHIQNVNMVSNGYLITEEIADKINGVGIKMVQISLDAVDEITHNHFRRNSEAYSKALCAIKHLCKFKGLLVAASFCPNRYNISKFNDYVEMLLDVGCKTIRVMPLLPMGRGLDNFKNYCPTYDQYVELISRIKLYNEKYNLQGINIGWGDPLEHIHRPLVAGHKQVISMEIRANGDIAPSIYLPFSFGNVRKHTLKEYWNNGFNTIWDNANIISNAKSILDIYDFSRAFPKAWTDKRITFDLFGGN